MIVSFHLFRRIAPAVMMMALAVSWAGPTIVSAVSLFDGLAATAPAGRAHLPLDMAAAPDQTAEAVDPSVGIDGSARDLQAESVPAGFQPFAPPVDVVHGPERGTGTCRQSLLCVYRL